MDNLSDSELRLIKFALEGFVFSAFSQFVFYSEKAIHGNKELADKFYVDSKSADSVLLKINEELRRRKNV